jgi:hypothetical protein
MLDDLEFVDSGGGEVMPSTGSPDGMVLESIADHESNKTGEANKSPVGRQMGKAAGLREVRPCSSC